MSIKWTWMIATFLLIQLNLNAQEGVTKVAKHTVYLEVIGIGGYGSINYERKVYWIKNQDLRFRIGLSTLNLRDFRNKLNPDLIIPIAINWLPGNLYKNHHLEIGVGQTISNIAAINISKGDVDRKTTISGIFNVGYRFQKSNGGFIFRIGYTPIFEAYQKFRHWGGISYGYAF